MRVLDVPSTAARRELVLAASLLVALGAAVDPAAAHLVALLVALAVLLAGPALVGGGPARWLRPMALPTLLSAGAAAAAHSAPAGLWLLAALGAFAVALDRILAIELTILERIDGASESDRTHVLAAAVATAFVAFTGVASLVPRGMPEPVGSPIAGASAIAQGWLLVLAAADAGVALVIGWRISALRRGQPLEVARSAVTYALVTAIAAGLVRAVDLPRLVGPAVLTLVFYLWDAQHGSAPARRRERRFVWEMILLAILAIVVVAWNLRVPT